MKIKTETEQFAALLIGVEQFAQHTFDASARVAVFPGPDATLWTASLVKRGGEAIVTKTGRNRTEALARAFDAMRAFVGQEVK